MFTPLAHTTTIENHAGSTSTVVLPSRLDVHSVDQLAGRVEHILRSGATWLTIDAGGVRHTDHAGLEFVRRLCHDLDRNGIACLVEDMSLALRIALELNGLHSELMQLDSRITELAAA